MTAIVCPTCGDEFDAPAITADDVKEILRVTGSSPYTALDPVVRRKLDAIAASCATGER